ncbi:MAG: hypothetical protein ACXW3P_05925 [Rhodospirillales bacterium]
MTACPARPAVPDIAAVPSLGSDTPILASDSFGSRQIADCRPDRARSSPCRTHHARSVPGSGPISEIPEAAPCRVRHPISGAAAAYSP